MLLRIIEALDPQALVAGNMRDQRLPWFELQEALSVRTVRVEHLDLLLGPLSSQRFVELHAILALEIAIPLVPRMNLIQVEARLVGVDRLDVMILVPMVLRLHYRNILKPGLAA